MVPTCQVMNEPHSITPTSGFAPTTVFTQEPTVFPTYGGLNYSFFYTIELDGNLTSQSVFSGTAPHNDVLENLIAATTFVLQLVLVRDLYPEGSDQLGFYRAEQPPIVTDVFKNAFLCSSGISCFTIKSSVFLFLTPEESEYRVRLAIKKGFIAAFDDGTFKKSVTL